MTPQPGYQVITMLVLPNISRIKDNQTMKFCQLIEYTKWNNLLAINESGRLVPDPFFVFCFKEKFYRSKCKCSAA